jgi:uncharacterized Ntn-hydrolase superfamily protein
LINPSTFSIVAADQEEKSCGIAVASKFLAVGSVVPWVKSNAGAIATQSFANTKFGPIGLKMLEEGLSAQHTLQALIASDPEIESRQIGIVDMVGGSATFTGKECLDFAGGIIGQSYAVQGNILTGKQVIEAMSCAFESSNGSLPWRLLSALKAGDLAGGDRRGRQSAAIYVVKPLGGYAGFNDRWVDLRVDDHIDPIHRLEELLQLHNLYFEKNSENEMIILNGEKLHKLQLLMKELDYYSGEANGVYDKETKLAFISFIGNENFEDRCDFISGKIDQSVFEYLSQKFLAYQNA